MSPSRSSKREAERLYKGVFVLARAFKYLNQVFNPDGPLDQVWANIEAREILVRLEKEVHEEKRAQIVAEVLRKAKVIDVRTA